MDLKDISVVLPSLDPDEKLLRVVDGLLGQGFTDIILVNDGSKPENLHWFETAAGHPEVHLLHHEVNRGKGAALKTAFRWFLENRPGALGVVTVDGDDQHHPEDTRACSEQMLRSGEVILGCRDFSLDHVPPRSRMGNKITCGVFRVLCGMTLSDTQTGLRAIPTAAVREFCSVEGDRFEYETNMLLALKERQIPYGEVKIRTVYIEENKSSHFRVVRDSWRIYKLLLGYFFRFLLSSLSSSVVDIALFALMSWMVRDAADWVGMVVPFLAARVISSAMNFIVNKKLVFRSRTETRQAAVRYGLLAVLVAVLQVGLTDGAYLLFGVAPGQVVLRTVIYTLVMTALYFLSYSAQARWVFAGQKEKK